MTNRRWWSALAGVVAAAAVVRVAYLALVAQDVDVSLDTVWYRLVSLQLAEGTGYVDPARLLAGGERVATAQFPPGWPALLSVGARLGFESTFAAQVTSCLVGAANVGLLGLLAARHLGRRWGLVAAAVAAVHPTLLVLDATGLAETPFTTAVLAALLLLDRPGRGVAVGAALGAATLVRSDGLVLVALAVAGLALTGQRRRAAVALAVAAAVVAPWVARNAVELDELTLSDNLGPTLAGANCERTWFGHGTGSWDFACTVDPDRGAGDAVDFAAEHPARLPVVAGARALRTWGLWDPFPDWPERRGEDLVGRDGASHAVSWAVSLALLPLAAVGLRRRWRAPGGRRRAWPLLVPAVAVVVVSVLVYGNQRFRAPAEPVVVLLAVAALAGRVRVPGPRGAPH